VFSGCRPFGTAVILSEGICSTPRLARTWVPHPFAHFAKGWEPQLYLRRHPERSALSDLSSRPSAKRAVEGPAVRLSWHEHGCPILSRTLRKSGNHNSINAVILSEAPSQICHPDRVRSAQWRDLQFASVGTKTLPFLVLTGCPDEPREFEFVLSVFGASGLREAQHGRKLPGRIWERRNMI